MNIETTEDKGWTAIDKDTDLDAWGETEKEAVYNLFVLNRMLVKSMTETELINRGSFARYVEGD